MNAANVMAISPKAGAASKVQGTRMAGKVNKASANAPQGSFDEALGKAGEEVTGKMAKSPTETQGNIQGNVDAKEAYIKDDMPEGTGAALNGQQGKEPKSGETPREWGKKSQGTKIQDSENNMASEQETDSLDTGIAAVLNFTAEGKSALVVDEQLTQENDARAVDGISQVKVDLPANEQVPQGKAVSTLEETYQQAKSTAEVNLQSLLPQSGDEIQKNKNFLAMLSGQQVKLSAEKAVESLPKMGTQAQEMASAAQPAEGWGMGQQMKSATMLEVQLNNHQLANRAVFQEGSAASQDLPLRTLQGGIQQFPLPNDGGASVPLETQATLQNEMGKASPLAKQAVRENLQLAFSQEPRGVPLAGAQEIMPEGAGRPQDNLNDLQLAILNNGKERQDAKGMALLRQDKETMPSMPAGRGNDLATLQETAQAIIPERTMPSMPAGRVNNSAMPQGTAQAMPTEGAMPSMPAGRVKDPVILQETGRGIIPEGTVQASPAGDKGDVPVNNPLAGVRITVEDVVPVTAPSMDMQENLQQGLYQQNQQALPETKAVTHTEGETVSQLAEEAVGDKSSIQSGPAPAANHESAAMFQQSLNDSLAGTKMTSEANQSQNLQEDFNVPRQIVEQARLLRRGEDTQMVIKLHPDHLGELTLKVSVSANGAVNASFHSDNAQVRAIIENTLVQLKQELNNQGLKVDNVDVYAGLTDGQLPQGDGQQAWQQNQGHRSNGSVRNLGDAVDYGEETENIAVGVQGTAEATDGVDYRI